MHGQETLKKKHSAEYVEVTGRRSIVRRRRKSRKRNKNVRRMILVKLILRNKLREAEEFRFL